MSTPPDLMKVPPLNTGSASVFWLRNTLIFPYVNWPTTRSFLPWLFQSTTVGADMVATLSGEEPLCTRTPTSSGGAAARAAKQSAHAMPIAESSRFTQKSLVVSTQPSTRVPHFESGKRATCENLTKYDASESRGGSCGVTPVFRGGADSLGSCGVETLVGRLSRE